MPKMSGNVLQDVSPILQVLLFRKNGETPFPKNKIQRNSPNFVHFMYLFFERILLSGNFGVYLCGVMTRMAFVLTNFSGEGKLKRLK